MVTKDETRVAEARSSLDRIAAEGGAFDSAMSSAGSKIGHGPEGSVPREDGIDAVMDKHELDALIAPTTGPAHTLDLIVGDRGLGGFQRRFAAAGGDSLQGGVNLADQGRDFGGRRRIVAEIGRDDFSRQVDETFTGAVGHG